MLVSEFGPDPARGSYPGEPLPERAPISHLALVERADLYLIAPASANTIAKLANGHADNLLTTAALAADVPGRRGSRDEQPDVPAPGDPGQPRAARRAGRDGDSAGRGRPGVARRVRDRAAARAAQLLAVCEALLTPPTWSGLRVLVTAGGTREPIDSVRFIGNRSSGKMGFALAREALRRGADVTLVAANVTLDPPPGVRVLPVGTAAELPRRASGSSTRATCC